MFSSNFVLNLSLITISKVLCFRLKSSQITFEDLKEKNAATLSNIKAAEDEYMNAVTSGAFVEKIEKAVVALESLDEKEQKIEEEKQKVEMLRAKNEATAKSLAGFDRKSNF